MTKKAFLDAMRAAIERLYGSGWANNPAALERFMESVRLTIEGKQWTWNHDGEACTAAWRAIGGKGKPTMKALRALAAE